MIARPTFPPDIAAVTAAAPLPQRPAAPRTHIIAALVVRETAARFGSSAGGYLWAFAEPIGGIVLLALAFSFIVQEPPLGDSFLFFYATGLLPFLMFNAVAGGAMNALAHNRGLLAYPVIRALDTILARAVLDALTYTAITLVILAGLVTALSLHLPFDPVALTVCLILTAALGLGIGTGNALLVGLFPAWRQIWSVLNRPLFILSGVFFTLDSIPDEMEPYVWFNPVAHLVAALRAAFFGADQADPAGLAYTAAVALGLFVTGGALIHRHQSRLIEG
jgi:capsular polysaccharide transport system permease protein